MTIRSDQIIELEQVQERLVDVVLREADPAEWARDTKETRRERIEQKRSAAATLTIITKISSVLNFLRGVQGPAGELPEEGVERPSSEPSESEIKAAAEEAEVLLKQYRDGKR